MSMREFVHLGGVENGPQDLLKPKLFNLPYSVQTFGLAQKYSRVIV